MGDGDSNSDGKEAPAASEPQVGPAISAAPGDADKQWSWYSRDARHRTRIVHYSSAAFPKSEKAGESGTHFAKSPDTDASFSTLLDGMRESVRGDIFTWVFHTHFEDVQGRIEALGVKNSLRKSAPFLYLHEIIAALKDGNPPAALVMGGCDTQRFFKPVIELAKVPVVLGIGIEGGDNVQLNLPALVEAVDCDAAADAMTASLMRGDSINTAVALGDAMIKSKLSSLPLNAVCAVGSVPWTGDDVDRDLSLQQNGLLPKFKKK